MGQPSSLRRDIVSAYVASGAKIASWVVVSAMVYRMGGAAQFGILALIRGTVGILNYIALGLGPAMVRMLAELVGRPQEAEIEPEETSVLSYSKAQRVTPLKTLYSAGITLTYRCSILAAPLCVIYAIAFASFREDGRLGKYGGMAIYFIGAGLLIRLISEPAGAVLQATRRFAKDNTLQLEAELVWILATVVLMLMVELQRLPLFAAAIAYTMSALWLLFRRLLEAEAIAGRPYWNSDKGVFKQLVHVGGLITLAQLADYLYAPTDYILINHFWDAAQVAVYAPAVQIDAGLLVLVSGLAAALFPRSALAHAAGDVEVVRKYYIRGTFASA